ncbi:MAG: hypothetical protein WCD65_19670, partial [Pseudolabrys sp.]
SESNELITSAASEQPGPASQWPMAMDRRPLADRRRERTDIVEEAIISQRAAERRQRAWPDRPGPKWRCV